MARPTALQTLTKTLLLAIVQEMGDTGEPTAKHYNAFAKKVGLSHNIGYNWLNGHSQAYPDSAEKLAKVAREYGYPTLAEQVVNVAKRALENRNKGIGKSQSQRRTAKTITKHTPTRWKDIKRTPATPDPVGPETHTLEDLTNAVEEQRALLVKAHSDALAKVKETTDALTEFEKRFPAPINTAAADALRGFVIPGN